MRLRDNIRNARPEVKEKRNEYTKEYRSRPEAKSKIRARENHRYKTDVNFAISRRMSSVMNECLRNTPARKQGRHWEDIVGYTLEELMSHLESKFVDGMSWNNRSEWHIDHIIPRAVFNITSLDCEEFKKCWALDNLQPLWWRDNVSKRDKLLHPPQ